MKQYDIQYLPIKSSKYIKNLITIQKNNLHFPVFLEYSNPITDDVSHFTFSVRNCIIKYEDIKGKISFDELYNRIFAKVLWKKVKVIQMILCITLHLLE